jgi:hypothetical protein
MSDTHTISSHDPSIKADSGFSKYSNSSFSFISNLIVALISDLHLGIALSHPMPQLQLPFKDEILDKNGIE